MIAMNGKILKIVGMVVSVAGAGCGLLGDAIGKKMINNEIAAQVAKAVADKIKES